MCIAKDCTRKSYKDTGFCWNHRGQANKIVIAEIILEETNIVEMPPHIVADTPVIAEVVDMPSPAAITPIGASNGEESKSNVEMEIADGAVYDDAHCSELELNNDVYRFDYDNKLNIVKFKELIDAWCLAGNSIDHQCVKMYNQNQESIDAFKAAGYTSRIMFDQYKGEKVICRRRLFFKSDDDKQTFIALYDKLDLMKYCLSSDLYDQRLFKLCCMVKKSWFSDMNNNWNLAGMLHRKQHVDVGLMRKTYLCILHTMTDRFDQAAALKVFNDWETSKYHPKLTESRLKSIAGGSSPEAYNEWKAEYEPKELKEKNSKKNKNEENLPIYPTFHTYYEKGELPPIFNSQDTETYLDVIHLKKSVITMERLYKFIKNNIAYILQGGNGYYLTKNMDTFSEIDYVVVGGILSFDMVFKINNAIELDDDGRIETDNTETDTESIISLKLMDAIHHYRDDITFGKIDFMPYNSKTGACDSNLNSFDWNSNEVFNKFNGFVHTYDPKFVVDESKFKYFSSHINQIWCSGRDDLAEHQMKLFAWYVQRPYEKSGACIVLEGSEGCGKNIIFGILKTHVIGSRYCLETPKIKVLTGRFNGARENKILTILNEAANVKQSSHEDQDELKDCITESTCMIEHKGVNPYKVKDCNNIVIASNNSYSVKASNQMRRFMYLVCKGDVIGQTEYFNRIHDEFNNTDSGIHLYHYLMSIDLDGFHPQNDAPMTEEKSDMQKSAIEKPVQWLIDCVSNSTDNSIFNDAQLDKTPDIVEFVSIDDMLTKYTAWLIEEAKDASMYSRDRFAKTLTKVLGKNYKRQIFKVRRRGYDLSVNGLNELLVGYTRRNDLFEE